MGHATNEKEKGLPINFCLFVNFSPQLPQRQLPGLRHQNAFAHELFSSVSPLWCFSRIIAKAFSLQSAPCPQPSPLESAFPSAARGPFLKLQLGLHSPPSNSFLWLSSTQSRLSAQTTQQNHLGTLKIY